MIFPPWSGFVFRFAFCSCHASLIMSSCASQLHTCSSHASEHFPRCPFCNPALPPPPVHPSCFLFMSGCRTFSEWTEACQVALVYHRSCFVPFGGRLVLQRLTGQPQSPFVCCSKTSLKTRPKPSKLPSMLSVVRSRSRGRKPLLIWTLLAPRNL